MDVEFVKALVLVDDGEVDSLVVDPHFKARRGGYKGYIAASVDEWVHFGKEYAAAGREGCSCEIPGYERSYRTAPNEKRPMTLRGEEELVYQIAEFNGELSYATEGSGGVVAWRSG